MAKTLSAKNRKRARKTSAAYKKNPAPNGHKIAVARSRRDKLKKAYRMT